MATFFEFVEGFGKGEKDEDWDEKGEDGRGDLGEEVD